MSNKKGLENKGNKGILTRQTTQNNPELKKQVDEINKEANIFSRKPRVTRSPPWTQLNNFASHTYVNVPLDSETEGNTAKTPIPTTSKADLNVLEQTNSQPTDNLEQSKNVTKSTQEINTPTININNLLIPETKQVIISPTEFYTPNSPDQTPEFFDDSTQLGRDRLHNYTDIGGLFNEQSLILGRENNKYNIYNK